LKTELNLDPELITDPDLYLQIISDPTGYGCTIHCKKTHRKLMEGEKGRKLIKEKNRKFGEWKLGKI
jgi:hypothetical protein